ncbi:MAG: membrane protein [Paraglaciecola sp.]|jgi:membrane protein
MNMAKTFLPSAEQQVHSRYSIVKRIVNLALAIIISLLFINLWLLSNEQVDNWHHKQANQLGNSLSLLASRVLVSPLIQKDPAAVTSILQQWVADPNVLSIAVHDQTGQLLQQQGDNIPLMSRYHGQQELPLIFLEDIHNEQQIYGYVRLMLSAEKVMAYHNDYQRQLRQQLEMFILLAACGALILTRAFYKLRYRNYAKTAKTDPKTKQ